MNNAPFREALVEIGKEALSEIDLSREDRDKMEEWVSGLGLALMAGDKDSAQGYRDAINLMVAKYEVRAGGAAEKALLKVLTLVGKVAVAALA